MKKKTSLRQVFIEHYKEIMLFGIVMVALAIWIYEYHYTVSEEALLGLLSACSLFFGILVLGQGIRGWRDGEGSRNRYIKMKSKGGAELMIRKRKKKKWRRW